ncbi:MAG: hypothetical protein E7331_09885 [Clostridiales bacterium]|nr:hypothetical protein [Clostridiales bacterium]
MQPSRQTKRYHRKPAVPSCQSRHSTPPQQALPGAFFSSVSEEKKQKKTAYAAKLANKKKPPQTGSPFLSKPPQLAPAAKALPGAFFSSVSEEKKQKKTAYAAKVGKQKETTANRQSLPEQMTLPHMRFSGGCGRGLFPGKSLLPPAPPLHAPAASPAGGLLFFCVRRKEAKEDHICSQVGKQKRNFRKPAVPS